MSPIAHCLLDSPHQRHSSLSGFARDTHIQRTDSLAFPGVIDHRRQLRIEPGTKREDERIGRRETYRREVGGGKKGSGIGACMVGHAGLGLCMRGNTRTCQIYHSARCIGTVDRSLPTLFNFPCSVRINKR